ncbi:MAG TPA: YihY/virulence factor BrkB family protein [Ideonella sp.]|nr:YihY/virulence factor BrkB family protein [Ideonella sp.]
METPHTSTGPHAPEAVPLTAQSGRPDWATLAARAWAQALRGWRIGLAAGTGFADAHGMRHGAAVAFYAAFSIAPLLVVVTAVMVWLLGDVDAQRALLDAVQQLIGTQEAQTLAALLANRPAVSLNLQAGSLTGWIALGTTLLGSTGVFVELRSALHAMLRQPEPPWSWWYLLQVRLIAVGVVLGCGFLLSIAMLLQGVALIGLRSVATRWPVLEPLLSGAEMAWSWGVITLLFAVMLRWLPDTRLAWRCAVGGAMVGASLFMVGRWAISLYIASTATQSALGAASSFAALLVWIYWSSQIFLLGAAWAVALRDETLAPHAMA